MGGSSRVSSFEDAQAAVATTRSSTEAFGYSQRASRSGRGTVHEHLNPLNTTRECLNTPAMPDVTAIAFGMDVTRSRGPDAKLVYEQTMPFLGSLFLTGAIEFPQILFAAIGDAKSDRAPLQVGQFESDERMDQDLERLWLEEGGGGTGEESYELFAYYLARHTNVQSIDLGHKGFCFITGDEAPYPTVSRDEVLRLIGDDLAADIPTSEIFAELQSRYRTFLLYPSKPLEDRQDDIDAEIRQRLLKAGGRFENCSVRASLIWNTHDDLDLHVVTPNGEEIFYGSKHSRCGGELDVDRNAHHPFTREPVENIRWAKGTAPVGTYQVIVRNYAHHESVPKDINFKVELEIDGKVESFEGVIPKGMEGPRSDITAFKFTYTPEQGVAADSDSREAYSDEVILAKWRECIPDANIIRLNDARWTTEAAIGVMAIQLGAMNLEQVMANMHERAVAPEGIADVSKALERFAAQAVVDTVREDVFA